VYILATQPFFSLQKIVVKQEEKKREKSNEMQISVKQFAHMRPFNTLITAVIQG
jgi:hypothetical protein